MHRVILDTHTFLWVLSDSPELSQTVREIVSDRRVDKILSLASVWEMAIKRGLGKLVLPTSLETLIGKARSAGLILAPLELAHVLGVEALPSYHRDPFDREGVPGGVEFEPVTSSGSVSCRTYKELVTCILNKISSTAPRASRRRDAFS